MPTKLRNNQRRSSFSLIALIHFIIGVIQDENKNLILLISPVDAFSTQYYQNNLRIVQGWSPTLGSAIASPLFSKCPSSSTQIRHQNPVTKCFFSLPATRRKNIRSTLGHHNRWRIASSLKSQENSFQTEEGRQDKNSVQVRNSFQYRLQRGRTILANALQKLLLWSKQPMSQIQQWFILIVYYFFHLLVLSQNIILFGWQLFPNDNGHFCSVGWDSVAGMVSLALFVYLKRGSVYFRKPWRRLTESFQIPSVTGITSTPSSPNQSAPASTASSESADKKKISTDVAVASKILEQVDRKVSLQRSSQTPQVQSEPIGYADIIKSPVLPLSTSKITNPVDATTDSTATNDANVEPKDNPESTSVPKSVLKTESKTEQTQSTTSHALQTEKVNGTPSSDNNQNENENETANLEDTKTADSSFSSSDNHKSDTVNNTGTQSDSEASPFKTQSKLPTLVDQGFSFDVFLSQRLNSLNDAFQEQFKKITSSPPSIVDDSGNTTRLEKQGVDLPSLSSLSLGTPEQRRPILARGTSIVAVICLVITYFATGRFAFFWEDALYAISGVGFPLTVAMHRSLCVLLGHLTWVGLGSLILRVLVRPAFFGSKSKWFRQNCIDDDGENDNENDGAEIKVDGDNENGNTKTRRGRKPNWIWWVIGGYSVSAWFFNIADFMNLYGLPAQVLEDAILQEGVVTQLINPENNDFLASLVGYIAPCISAPWWEEMLYRGFFFPALSLFVPVWASILIGGIVFSAHHLSLTAALPLAVLGWTWSALYMASDNLWTTILVHALWNSRVFLSSWLGV